MPSVYLLAALVYWIVFPHFGWRGLFVVGALPALLVIYIRAHVPESPVWERNRASGKPGESICGASSREHGRYLIYAALLMTAFNYMSHGTQDLYPTFLEKQRGFGVSANIDDHDCLCHRHDLWRHGRRVSFATMGPASRALFCRQFAECF